MQTPKEDSLISFKKEIAKKIREYKCWMDFLDPCNSFYSDTTPDHATLLNQLFKAEQHGKFEEENAESLEKKFNTLIPDISRTHLQIQFKDGTTISCEDASKLSGISMSTPVFNASRVLEKFRTDFAGLGNYTQGITEFFTRALVYTGLKEYLNQLIQLNSPEVNQSAKQVLSELNFQFEASNILSARYGSYFYINTNTSSFSFGKLPPFSKIRVFELFTSIRDEQNQNSQQRLCALACSDFAIYRLFCILTIDRSPVFQFPLMLQKYFYSLSNGNVNVVEREIVINNFLRIFDATQSQLTLSYIFLDLQIGIFAINPSAGENRELSPTGGEKNFYRKILELRQFLQRIFFTFGNANLQNLILNEMTYLNHILTTSNTIRNYSEESDIQEILKCQMHELLESPYIYFLDIMEEMKAKIKYLQDNFSMNGLKEKCENLRAVLDNAIRNLPWQNKQNIIPPYDDFKLPIEKALQLFNSSASDKNRILPWLPLFSSEYAKQQQQLNEIYRRLEHMMLSFIHQPQYPLPPFLSCISDSAPTVNVIK